VPASSILLLAADPGEADRIGESLRAAGHTVEVATDGADLVARAAGCGALLIDLPGDGTAAADLMHELRANPQAAPLPVLCFAQTPDVDERVRLLEAGADDVIARPYDARELAARVDALTLRFHLSGGGVPVRQEPAVETRRNQVIAVFGAKGGVGATTIAVNVAIELAERRPGQVSLIDLALPLGQVPTHLDLRPRHQFADLFSLPEDSSARSAADPYGSLDVYCAPDDLEIADRVTAGEIAGVLDTLRQAYLFVVVDAGASLDARTLALLETADRIVLVTTPEIPSLRALVAVEQVLGDRGLGERTLHVINHLFAHEPLKRSDIEETLGTSVDLELPLHDLLFARAVNEGVPVVRSAPRSEPAERLGRLASILAGTADPGEEASAPRRRFRLLGRGT